MLANPFSHYHNRRCRRMVLEVVGVTNPLHILIAVGANAWDMVFACGMHEFYSNQILGYWVNVLLGK